MGVLIIRVIVFWGSLLGSLVLRKLPYYIYVTLHRVASISFPFDSPLFRVFLYWGPPILGKLSGNPSTLNPKLSSAAQIEAGAVAIGMTLDASGRQRLALLGFCNGLMESKMKERCLGFRVIYRVHKGVYVEVYIGDILWGEWKRKRKLLFKSAFRGI